MSYKTLCKQLKNCVEKVYLNIVNPLLNNLAEFLQCLLIPWFTSVRFRHDAAKIEDAK